MLDLQLGRFDEAIAALDPVVSTLRSVGVVDPGYIQASAELVEACLRGGRTPDAERELGVLDAEAQTTGRVWALAAAARCRGLLAGDGEFDEQFEAALSWHAQTDRPLEQARTELAYGERLRHAGRRTEARERLRAALGTFDRLGARIFGERARTELAASGERIGRHKDDAEALTPQELQVALVVSRGATNKEAAGELFLSTKTIEFHLRNAYRKLGVRSRTELANALRGGEAVAS